MFPDIIELGNDTYLLVTPESYRWIRSNTNGEADADMLQIMGGEKTLRLMDLDLTVLRAADRTERQRLQHQSRIPRPAPVSTQLSGCGPL